MKYIVTKNKDGKEEMFTFPDSVHHDVMSMAVVSLKDQTHGDWKRIERKVVSAGFVTGGVCHGKSESLHLESRARDNDILKSQQNENN